ncbi:MAG: hypothetical protein KY468_03080 [Armatimonadetes bacterium]|nr:hypothetical protein [Armatimonadota bacterium]
MKARLSCFVWSITAALLLFAVPSAKSQASYKHTDLYKDGVHTAVAINNKGQITGAYQHDFGHVYLWENGRITTLDRATVAGMNNRGQVVGQAVHPMIGQYRAALLEKGQPIQWLLLPPTIASLDPMAIDINDSGQILITTFQKWGHQLPKALLWEGGALTDLAKDAQFVRGGQSGQIRDSWSLKINNNGQVIGTVVVDYGYMDSDTHAYIWDREHGMQDQGIDQRYNDINDHGQIAGATYTGSISVPSYIKQAFFLENGEKTFINPLPGHPRNTATALNNKGQTIGVSYDEEGYTHAFAWDKSGGVRALENYLPRDAGIFTSVAQGINDQGQIVGYYRFEKDGIRGRRSFLLSPGIVWGAKVEITKTDDTKLTDFLVAFGYGSLDYLILQSHLDISGDGFVNPTDNLPLSEVKSIRVLPDPKDASDPDRFTTYGFNKYIVVGADPTLTVSNTTRTVELEENAYSNGRWRYKIASIKLDDDRTLQEKSGIQALYALPRIAGTNNAAARKADPSTDAPVREKLKEAAHARDIPPSVLYAMAWHESLAPGRSSRFLGLGWNQFGFIGERDASGSHGYSDDAEGQELTLVTYDGGIGIMQITGATALSYRPAGTDMLTHLYRLSSDIAYHATAGSFKLMDSWRIRPIGDPATRSRSVLEHWHNAVWAYNGWKSQPLHDIYTLKIWETLEHPPGGRWPSARLMNHLSTYYAPTGFANGSQIYLGTIAPTLGAGTATKPAHADADRDGSVDVELSAPSVTTDGKDSITVSLHVLPRTGVAVGPVSALLTVNDTVHTVELIGEGNVYTGTLEGIGRVRSLPSVSFTVTVNGAAVQGVTYTPGTLQVKAKKDKDKKEKKEK